MKICLKKYINSIVLLLLIISLTACQNIISGNKSLLDNQFIDAAGNVLTVKENANELTVASAYGVAVPFFTALKISDRVKAANVKQKFWEEADTNFKGIESTGKGQFDLEKLAKINPSCVIHRANDKKTLDELKKIGIETLCIRVESYDDVINTLSMMGKYFGAENEATNKIDYLTSKFNRINELVRNIPDDKRKTAIVFGGTLGRVAGSDMLQAFMVKEAGGIYKVSESKNNSWINIGVERIFEYNPDYIFITGSSSLDYEIDELYSDSVWSGIDAIKNKKVFYVPSKLDSWDMPGLSCAIGTMYMLHKMYPELISKEELIKEVNEYYMIMFDKTFDLDYLGCDLE